MPTTHLEGQAAKEASLDCHWKIQLRQGICLEPQVLEHHIALIYGYPVVRLMQGRISWTTRGPR